MCVCIVQKKCVFNNEETLTRDVAVSRKKLFLRSLHLLTASFARSDDFPSLCSRAAALWNTLLVAFPSALHDETVVFRSLLCARSVEDFRSRRPPSSL